MQGNFWGDTFKFEVQPLSSKKNREAGGCEAQAFSRASVNFVGNPRGMLQCKLPSFSSESTAAVSGSYSRWFRVPKGCADGKNTPAHSSGLRWFYGR